MGYFLLRIVVCAVIIVTTFYVRQVVACAASTERDNPIVAFDLHGVVLKYDWLKIIPTLANFDQKWSLIKDLRKLPYRRLFGLLYKKPSFEQALQLIEPYNVALHKLMIELSVQQKLVPEVAALIENLHNQGHALHVVSNIGAESYRRVKERFINTFQRFSVVVTSDMHDSAGALVKKPDVLFFETYLRSIKANPDKVFFIDNRMDNVQAARTLGMNAIHFKNIQQLYQECRQCGLLA